MRFEYLLGRAQSRAELKHFSRDELYELGRLYRRLAADLARAQTIGEDKDIQAYLNGLLSQAYKVIYQGDRQPGSSILRFVTRKFPQAFRRNFGVILIAILVFLVPAIWAYFAYLVDPAWSELAMHPFVRQIYENDLQKGPNQLAAAIREDDMAVASTFIILNNAGVSALAFAGGILFGVGTIYLLIQNGLLLGTIAGIFIQKGPEFSLYFFSGILPHGVLELPAICIAGGGGLLLGKALLIPGELRRIDALKKNGREALNLVLGVMLMLVAAGIIEGFITPLKIGGRADVPVLEYAKLSFSAVAFLAMVAYLLFTGRNPGEKPLEFIGDSLAGVRKYSPGGIFRVLKSETQDI